jgi:hypothetical protein
VRETNITKFVEEFPSAAADVSTVSLGDEISIIGHGNDTTFHAWCKQEAIGLADLGCKTWTSCPYIPNIANASTHVNHF